MKSINNYINERLVISKKLKQYQHNYTCQPKDKDELKYIIKQRISQDKNANLNDIDVSQITDMSFLFSRLDLYNIDISKWDVNNVEDMSNMFAYSNFTGENGDISNWDVSNVIDMSYMFYKCKNFNCDLSNWNVSHVKFMNRMFSNCENFNFNLENWDVSNVKDMSYMFYECEKLNKIPSWYKE